MASLTSFFFWGQTINHYKSEFQNAEGSRVAMGNST